MDLKSKIILISGPTASGKSKFAIQLAKKINGELINADSMQIFKELKILSARPFPKNYKNIKHHLYGFKSVKKNFSSGDWLKLVKKKILEIKKRKKIKHHLYGFKSVKNNYSTGNWLKEAKKKINNIKKKNKIPILVGGTGLYFKALIDGIVKIPQVPQYIRNKIRKKQSKIGQIKFYSELIKLDPLCKKKINKNDT